jgi:hypothetical protein
LHTYFFETEILFPFDSNRLLKRNYRWAYSLLGLPFCPQIWPTFAGALLLLFDSPACDGTMIATTQYLWH